MEKKVENLFYSNKERILCSDYSFGINDMNCDFDRLMKCFYDNDIKCMGICHDQSNEIPAHYHIVTLPYLNRSEFEKVSDIKKYYRGQLKGMISDITAYLLHFGYHSERIFAEKYKITDIKTNIDLKKYQNDLLKHGISFN